MLVMTRMPVCFLDEISTIVLVAFVDHGNHIDIKARPSEIHRDAVMLGSELRRVHIGVGLSQAGCQPRLEGSIARWRGPSLDVHRDVQVVHRPKSGALGHAPGVKHLHQVESWILRYLRE